MPELIEVEQYRRALDPLLGCSVTTLDVRHREFVRPRGTPVEVLDVFRGGRLIGTRRHGKLLLLDIGLRASSQAGCTRAEVGSATMGIRFGMTGMLFVDGVGPIDRLEYASARVNPDWDRLVLGIGGSSVTIRDQRRLGSVELDPDTSVLGPEATTIDADGLAAVLLRRHRAVKSVLLDQSRIAGLGNLLVDEILWRAGIAPHRAAEELSSSRVSTLAATIRSTVEELSLRGGSHMGDSFPHRVAGAACPNGDGNMKRDTVGGRTTWWCPGHQS